MNLPGVKLDDNSTMEKEKLKAWKMFRPISNY